MKNKNEKKHSKFVLILIIFAYAFPFIITLHSIFSGGLAFWYDPARDLLSGLANIDKLTLIGPTSGIPGLFYGPYWIWALSIGLLVSHDPRIVAFIVAALPYFTILPLVFYSLSRVVGKVPVIIGWVIFMLVYGGYSSQLWNPNPGPLLVFTLLILLLFLPKNARSLYSVIYILGTGFIGGLLVQFHISFGISVLIGVVINQLLSMIYSLINNSDKRKIFFNHIFVNVLLGIGIITSALPFFVFELRHGFSQINTVLTTLSSSESVVSVVGITDMDIVINFILRYFALVSLPIPIAIGVGVITLLVYGYTVYKSKDKAQFKELPLVITTVIIALTVLSLYLISKNPVWDYHFIGVEVLFVILIVCMISRSKILLYLYSCIALYIVVLGGIHFYSQVNSDPKRLTSFATKQYVVESIFENEKNDNFAIIAYNPAIYTFDYDYLTQWIAEKNNRNYPKKESDTVNTVYLIIPPNTAQAISQDFINYKTPNAKFSTDKTWEVVDGTRTIKRVKMIE